MADDRLTAFLVDLCINKDDLLDKFKTPEGRHAALTAPGRNLSEDQVNAFTGLAQGDMKALIGGGTQQGGSNGREKEANALAKKAASLADEAKSVAKSAKAFAKSIAKPKKKKKKSGKR